MNKPADNCRFKHKWLNPKAKVQKSPIHGLGVFASGLIPKGETVCVFGGVAVHRSDIAEHRKQVGHRGFQIDDNFFLCPASDKEIQETGAFNHSCESNIGFADTVRLIAIRNIRAGEELVFDYVFSESYFEPFECKCGSPNCRKMVTPDDWKNKEVQQKYGEYFSPYLKRRFQ